ncbi:hypothetical protein ACROYT_G024528 [Oculina patagonica]
MHMHEHVVSPCEVVSLSFLRIGRRSQIQKAAVKVWPGNEFPNFRTAENKNKLDELAESLKEECSIPEIQFGVEGIRKHIQSVFNERRRLRKREKIDYDLPDKRMSLKDDKGKPPLPTMSVYDNDEVNKNKESNDSNEGSDESGDTEILNSLSENSDHDGPDESQPALKKAKKIKKKNVTGKKQNKNDSSQSSNSNLKADQEVSAINLSAKSAKVLLLSYSGEAAVEDISREYLYQIIKELGGKVSLAKQLQGDALFKAVAVKLVNHGLVTLHDEVKEGNDCISNDGSNESGDTEILNSSSEKSDGPDESQPVLKKSQKKKTKEKNVTGKKQNKNDSSQSSYSDLKTDQEVSAINLSTKSAKLLLLTYSGEAAVEDISREYLYQIIKELGGKVSLEKQLQGDALFKAVAVKLVNHGLVNIKAGATLLNLKRSDIITE